VITQPAVAPAVLPPAQVGSPQLVTQTINATATLSGNGLAGLTLPAAQLALGGVPLQNGTFTSSTQTLTPVGVLSAPVVPSSYPGRLALAGTGVTQRVATGDGPFTQPPGLFLPGGNNGLVPQGPVRRVPRPVAPPSPPSGSDSTAAALNPSSDSQAASDLALTGVLDFLGYTQGA